MAAAIGLLLRLRSCALLFLLLFLAAFCKLTAARPMRTRPSKRLAHLPSQLLWELEKLARHRRHLVLRRHRWPGHPEAVPLREPLCRPRLRHVRAGHADSCGYIALSHSPTNPRLILAFRGTYSIANTIADLSTIPQDYVPYPGRDDHETTSDFLVPRQNDQDPPPADPPKCQNCTVHTGFYSSWLNTRNVILPHVTEALEKFPNYKLVLVGHSLGGAVAALAGLDFNARGWDAHVTTFGEPRLGNNEFSNYIDERFNITPHHESNKFHRVTHAGDPVPLLPLAEWGYSMHSEEIFISETDLPFSIADVQYCDGNEDVHCIAGSDRDRPSWAVPARFKFWQLFFAHRDYFWRLGLCLPGASTDPAEWYPKNPTDDQIPELEEL
ncbi:hypothetical protein SNOG_03923 [Parastagonospora nodorum SN15]|uniref:Fungal lipase-type domain-containing protein n=1 Tax=Phaeosphaeria nodorum (strain SN15 / ATCC MYA-4574 / FGSC 10173) TaxID=321614 RepID=Q0UWE1_PHANO|nr:hypothetical protein SNOG_03923 [Parastagonospora nodorum SN15]EAT89128.2 hypothetical protein SNOG_03923 [Parastagonospora nodorum SN15]